MPNWILIVESAYVLLTVFVCMRVVYDTRSTTKTLAYLLMIIFLPVVGSVLYFFVGINYRKRKLYNKKIVKDEELLNQVKKKIKKGFETSEIGEFAEVFHFRKLARLIISDGCSPVYGENRVRLLLNGEQKFKEVLAALAGAKHHIHIQYYIFEDDGIGNKIKDLLIQKVKEGVKVRFIYDDFGSRSIRKTLVPELKEAGVQAFPFYRIAFLALANRLNYRNHRKIIVIDGSIAFTGGINVSDKYINGDKKQLYWRDTHLRIEGPGIYYLQYLFIGDWNTCSGENLDPKEDFFSFHEDKDQINKSKNTVQIVASGPDSETPSILLSLLQSIHLAQSEILITTPYFIPGESLLDAIKVATLSGIKIKLLVPDASDSKFVNWASRSYYGELLDSNVEIFLYKKGFIHAKTMVVDGLLAIVGTANMDQRSFELNFEVNTLIYDEDVAMKLKGIFHKDLEDADRIDPLLWSERPRFKQLPEKLARLLSPLL